MTTTALRTDTVLQRNSRRVNATLIAGIALTAAIGVAVLIVPPFLPSPTEPHLESILLQSSGGHPFGTDQLGRDVLSRVLHGMRLDLGIAILALLAPMLVGSALGAAAAWFGGWFDQVIGVLGDVVQAFPYYLLIIVLVFFLGAGAGSIFVAVAVVAWVSYARIVRGEVQTQMHQDYVQAALGSGLSEHRILLRHVMPNCFRQPLAYYATDVVIVIIGTATLSYLGLGIAPPTAELGAMIADGQQFIGTNPMPSVAPGLAVVLIGAALCLLGQGLAEQLEQS